MLFTPNYAVSYKGRFYRAGEQFEIAENDVVEMNKHGIIQPFEEQQEPPESELSPEEDEEQQEPPESELSPEEDEEQQEPPKRAGRSRKGAEQ